jgi:hypothetical protein
MLRSSVRDVANEHGLNCSKITDESFRGIEGLV